MTDRSDSGASPPPSKDAVSWVAFPDRNTDRIRLTVWHFGAGGAASFGLGILALLVLLAVESFLGPDRGLFVVVVTLVIVGGPGSLLYMLLAADQGTARDRERFLPSVEWVRLRYLPAALLGGAGLWAGLIVHPATIYIYPLAVVVAAAAVTARYSVGWIDPTTATLQLAAGTDAVEDVLEEQGVDDPLCLGPENRHSQRYDLRPLCRTYRVDVGGYAVFGCRYRRRGWWGRLPLLVVPMSAADQVETALDTVVATSEWEPGEGMDRSVRVALGGLGLFFLAAAGGVVAIAGARADGVGRLAMIPGGFGALMLLVAVRG